MSFAELSIAEIANEYALSAQDIFNLCDEMGIRYKDEQTCLALEDAKAILSHILSSQASSTDSTQKEQI